MTLPLLNPPLVPLPRLLIHFLPCPLNNHAILGHRNHLHVVLRKEGIHHGSAVSVQIQFRKAIHIHHREDANNHVLAPRHKIIATVTPLDRCDVVKMIAQIEVLLQGSKMALLRGRVPQLQSLSHSNGYEFVVRTKMNVAHRLLEGKAVENDSLPQIRKNGLSVHVHGDEKPTVVGNADAGDILTGLKRKGVRRVVHQVKNRYAVPHRRIEDITIRGIAHITAFVHCSEKVGETI